MNDDLLKKLLAGLPQQDELSQQIGNSPAYEVAPNLDPSIYPSPLAYPEPRMAPLDFTNEPAEKVVAEAVPANVKPSLPFAKNLPTPQQAPQQQEELPKQDKKPSLADILAGTKGSNNNDLQNEQLNANDTIRNLLMMKGVNTMAQSLVNQKADPNFLNEHMALARQGVQDIKDKQKHQQESEEMGFKRSKNAIDESKAVIEVGNSEKENDENSNLSKSLRTMLQSQADIAKLPIKIDQSMSYAQLQKLYPSLVNQITAKMGEDAKSADLRYKYAELGAMNKSKNEGKQAAVQDKQFDNFAKSVDYRNKSSRTAGGKIMTALDVSDRLSGLISKNPNDMTSQEMRELVTGVNTLIGGSQAVSQIEHMDYPTLARTYSEMSTKITGKPQPMNSPEVVNRLKSLIDREHGILRGQLKKDMDIQKKRHPGLVDDARVDDLYNEILGNDHTEETNTSDPRVDRFMKDNNINNREEAIAILKKEGHL